ncbi:hypothetical protein CROQUDRAFT_704617 [Cronartium quercuum f. sp. fusiforme G11]|uniref:Uncharacterized protein n=1 Tax=Cronartium quercuum f. sp. fusiforme G11 TaxID=708437 RepID=A0A9P6TB54_9BASI|nr:hypothetical protein CROQUDRAFT_704617 [Cronartium quercuum f. sp. fusiforme G11]
MPSESTYKSPTEGGVLLGHGNYHEGFYQASSIWEMAYEEPIFGTHIHGLESLHGTPGSHQSQPQPPGSQLFSNHGRPMSFNEPEYIQEFDHFGEFSMFNARHEPHPNIGGSGKKDDTMFSTNSQFPSSSVHSPVPPFFEKSVSEHHENFQSAPWPKHGQAPQHIQSNDICTGTPQESQVETSSTGHSKHSKKSTSHPLSLDHSGKRDLVKPSSENPREKFQDRPSVKSCLSIKDTGVFPTSSRQNHCNKGVTKLGALYKLPKKSLSVKSSTPKSKNSTPKYSLKKRPSIRNLYAKDVPLPVSVDSRYDTIRKNDRDSAITELDASDPIDQLVFGYGFTAIKNLEFYKTDIGPWCSMMEKALEQKKMEDYIKEYNKKWRYSKNTVYQANRLLTTSFLGMLLLINQKSVQLHGPKALLEQGWSFIHKILDEWKTMDFEEVTVQNTAKVYNFIDGTQAEALLHRLARSEAHEVLSTSFLYRLWLRWYRETTYPYRKFIATESNFIQDLKLSLQTSKPIVNDEPQTAHVHTGHKIFESPSYELLLQQHNLKFYIHMPESPQGEYYSKNTLPNGSTYDLSKHVGQFEVQILEHFEPTKLWFDSLIQDLQRQSHNSESDLRISKMDKIMKLMNGTYKNLIIPFFGTIRILHYNALPDKMETLDPRMKLGWEFLKSLLSSWNDIDISAAIESGCSDSKIPTGVEYSPGRALLQIVLPKMFGKFGSSGSPSAARTNI